MKTSWGGTAHTSIWPACLMYYHLELLIPERWRNMLWTVHSYWLNRTPGLTMATNDSWSTHWPQQHEQVRCHKRKSSFHLVSHAILVIRLSWKRNTCCCYCFQQTTSQDNFSALTSRLKTKKKCDCKHQTGEKKVGKSAADQTFLDENADIIKCSKRWTV